LDLTLRPIREEDTPFLYRLYASTRVEELAPLDWDDARKEGFLQMQFEAQHRDYRARFLEARFDIVEQAGEAIGRLYVDERPEEIRIIDIALLPEYRNAGLGSRLLGELLDRARAYRKPVRIHVEKLNPARRLYERLGFVAVSDVGVYELMEWSPSAEAQVKTSS
jgi:ribosomal protein S18 acetylase RimI-like enzyme